MTSIKSDNNTTIIANDNKNYESITYRLTPDSYRKLELSCSFSINDFIKRFLNIYEEYSSIEIEKISDLINRFFYTTFNSDVNTVLQLINRENSENLRIDTEEIFTPSEAEIINDFLNWDDDNKNKFVLNLISACFNYCMLTVKKDNSSYKDIFNNKSFYFDANVIFRLAGFNKLERQHSIKMFVEKCKSSCIQLKYTNVTYDEIRKTIHHYVAIMKKLFKNRSLIKPDALRMLNSKYANLDFYEQYYEWTTKPYNRPEDYESFEKDLIKKVDSCLKDFQFVSFEPYNKKRKYIEYFEEYCKDYKSYKQAQSKTAYDDSIETDINNYLFIKELNSNKQANSFLEIHNYFISADHSLTNWTKEMNIGSVPCFVLPSVWYSILLKYKGRNHNDYSAFTQFLNIRIAPEEDSFTDLKSKLLGYVMEINDTSNVKESIIYSINKDLQNPSITIPDPCEYVKEVYKNTLQDKVNEAVSEEKARGKETAKAAYSDGKGAGVQQGVDATYRKIAEHNIDRNKVIKKTLTIIFLIFAAIFVAIIILQIFLQKTSQNSSLLSFIETYDTPINWITAILALIPGLFRMGFNKINIFNTDIDKEIEKLKSKLEK